MKSLLLVGVLAVLSAPPARAQPVGETHRVASTPTARLRDAQHLDRLRITVWYPATADAVEQPLFVGPQATPLFDVGTVAPDAPFAAVAAKWPVILLSHGFGGSARIMGWFGIAMARTGHVVVAVDHPGNNSADATTVPGAILWWDRAEDLQTALAMTEGDPGIGAHMDSSRIGVAGFSAGGFTALVAAGARVDRDHFDRFCRADPEDGVCRPQREFTVTPEDAARALAAPEIATEVAHAGDD